MKAINQHFEELLQPGEEPEHKGEFSTPTRALGRLGNEGFWDGDSGPGGVLQAAILAAGSRAAEIK